MKQWRDFLIDPSITQQKKAEILCFGRSEISSLSTAINTKEKLQQNIVEYLISDISVEDLEFDKISPSHYTEISKAPEAQQIQIVEKVLKEKLNVNETRRLVHNTVRGAQNDVPLPIDEEKPVVEEYALRRKAG